MHTESAVRIGAVTKWSGENVGSRGDEFLQCHMAGDANDRIYKQTRRRCVCVSRVSLTSTQSVITRAANRKSTWRRSAVVSDFRFRVSHLLIHTRCGQRLWSGLRGTQTHIQAFSVELRRMRTTAAFSFTQQYARGKEAYRRVSGHPVFSLSLPSPTQQIWQPQGCRKKLRTNHTAVHKFPRLPNLLFHLLHAFNNRRKLYWTADEMFRIRY